MITEEQAMRLLIEVNPVPDLSTLDVNDDLFTTPLVASDMRSSEMTELKPNHSDTTPIPGRRRVFIGAVATVAVMVIGALLLLQSRDQAPVAGQPTTPVETAEAFIEAYRAAFDVDEAFALLAADPETFGFGPLAEERLFVRFLEATGNKLVNLQCEELSVSADGTVVRCAYVSHSFFSDELGLGPYGPDGLEFTVVNEEIVAMREADPDTSNNTLGLGPFSDEIWVPFAAWIGENHPDDRTVMYDPYPTGWRITEESIPLWEQRLREYVEERNPAVSGLTGLPPEDATPSTPENGELVASMWEHIGALGSFGNGWLYVYADGRLIWDRGDPDPTGGWLERRLTPEGVEIIRSEIIDTGLFPPDQPPLEPNNGFPREINGGYVQVRNGDQLVYVNRIVPGLHQRLGDLWSWLPDDAWEEAEARAYVPSRYAVCLDSNGSFPPTGTSEQVSELPAAARDLLANARQLHMDALVDIDPAGFAPGPMKSPPEYCLDITTEEARSLAMILDEAGRERPPQGPHGVSDVRYTVSEGVMLTLWPMLPHGVPAFTGA